MIHYLKSIPGPQFLLLFFKYVLCVIFFTRISLLFTRTRLKHRYHKEILQEDLITPIELIVIKDTNVCSEIIEFYLYKLWKDKYLSLEGDKTNPYLKTNKDSKLSFLVPDEIELEILKHYDNRDTPNSIMHSKILLKKVENLIKKTRKKLENKKSVNINSFNDNEKIISTVGFLALTIPFIIKLCLGIINGKPVLALVVLYVLMLFIYALINKVRYRPLIIDKMESKYPKVSSSKASDEQLEYSMCLYGPTSLINYPETILFSSIIANQDNHSSINSSSNNTSGGGGSSCSGCSSCGGCGVN